MAKKKKRGKKTKTVRLKVDEVFERGPLRVERFGRFIRMQNTASDEEHAELRKRANALSKETLKEIEAAVLALQALVARHDPLELMHRAAYVLLQVFMGGPSESELSSDESFYLPTVEYLQYLVARTEFTRDAAKPTEEQWQELWAQAVKVLRLTQTYLILRKTNSDPPTEIDHLRFMIDHQRLLMRVDRYSIFQPDHLRSALTPMDTQIRETYGVGVEEIIDGISKIDQYQKTGVFRRYEETFETTNALIDHLARAGYNAARGATAEEIKRIQEALTTEEFKSEHERAEEAARLTFTPAIFDITDLTSLPKQFLSLLSVRPSESVLTSLTGPNHDDLSPLSPSVLHQRPFVEIDGRFYTFFHSGFEDRIADLIEADLFTRLPERIGDMTEKRGDRLEQDARELLTSLVRPDVVHSNVYYPNPDDSGNLTELDLLIAVDDILLLVEAKAGGIDAAARRGAPESLAQALSDLIVEGQRQSERAEKYIRSGDEVPFFDSSGKQELCRIRHSRYRRVFRIIVTREELGWVGARIAILSVLDPGLSKSLPWHVSVDDLRVIAHLFANDEIRFAHFLEARLLAAAEPVLSQADEIEHVGLYNKMNHYHHLPAPDISHMSYAADYMLDIDHYFRDLAAGIDAAVPTQTMPGKVRQLIKALEGSGLRGRFEVGSVVLSMSSEARNGFAKSLDDLETGLRQGRHRSIRMGFDEVGLTISFADGPNWEEELHRSAVQMEESKCDRWIVVRLARKAGYEVQEIEVITPGRFARSQLAGARAAHDRKTREMITMDQPGRNDPCPCGSRKKFKKCHGR